MRKLAVLPLIVGLASASACAPKTVAVPIVTAPKYPDFVKPAVPPAFADAAAADSQDRGWSFLQGGDLKSAEREFATALKAAPSFFPAESGLGYVELARKDGAAALPHFDRALQLAGESRDVSTLLGRGEALLALNRDNDAVGAFEAAVAMDPTLTEVARRVEVLKFKTLEQDTARGREAARAGHLDEASRAYASAIARSPDSAFLYRELGAVDRRKGDADGAMEHYRKAVQLDPSDAASLVQIGELLENRSDFDAAAKAYESAQALDPNPTIAKRLEVLHERAELLNLPEEYRAIEEALEITRADLAALIGVRLAPLLVSGRAREAVLITDLRSTWAAPWIMSVARAGIMDPFANHAFEPRMLIRRTDLAQAASRLLDQIAAADAAHPRPWVTARLQFSDLSPTHLAYPAASEAVSAGVILVGSDKAFQPSRIVTGAEATAAVDRIAALAAPITTGRGRAGR